MTPDLVPESEAEARQMIAAARAAGTPLAICGGNTRAGLGRPVQAEKTLSSRALSGIVAYDPAELVIIARAGTAVAEIEAALEKNGQRLVFEPMDHRPLLSSQGEPTIGAIAAGNISGPRRLVAGAARDSLLGVRFVNGAGEVVKNGGRVMKNVTGLDLVKFMAGSWGTLGFLTEVTFKVLPAAETETTLAIRGLLDDAAVTAMAHAMATSAEVSGAAHLPELVAGTVLGGKLGNDAATLLRLEGFEASVAIRAGKLKSLLGAMGEIEELGAADSRRLWREVRDCIPFADGTQKPVWRVSMKPGQAHEMVMAMRMQTGASAFYDWQGGLAWVRMENDPADELVRREIARHGGGHATLVRADPQYRLLVPVFQPEQGPVAELSKRIKAKFDPASILNPGRMVQGM
ncbi:MAG: FAD-binding protein [Notoacmeibacter sp.]|nr:FAD-binding protein [Notoacmeibacter sp.]